LSINDPVFVIYDAWKDRRYYYLKRGPETFYDEECVLRTWPSEGGARDWCETELVVIAEPGVTVINDD